MRAWSTGYESMPVASSLWFKSEHRSSSLWFIIILNRLSEVSSISFQVLEILPQFGDISQPAVAVHSDTGRMPLCFIIYQTWRPGWAHARVHRLLGYLQPWPIHQTVQTSLSWYPCRSLVWSVLCASMGKAFKGCQHLLVNCLVKSWLKTSATAEQIAHTRISCGIFIKNCCIRYHISHTFTTYRYNTWYILYDFKFSSISC